MEKIVKKFSSHQEAESAEYEYWSKLSPEERFWIGLNLYYQVVGSECISKRVIKKVVSFRNLHE